MLVQNIGQVKAVIGLKTWSRLSHFHSNQGTSCHNERDTKQEQDHRDESEPKPGRARADSTDSVVLQRRPIAAGRQSKASGKAGEKWHASA
jgi:hypothetical protein